MSDDTKKAFTSAVIQFLVTGAIGLVLWYAAFEVKLARAEERIADNSRDIVAAKTDIVRRLERIEDKIDRVRQ